MSTDKIDLPQAGTGDGQFRPATAGCPTDSGEGNHSISKIAAADAAELCVQTPYAFARRGSVSRSDGRKESIIIESSPEEQARKRKRQEDSKEHKHRNDTANELENNIKKLTEDMKQ